MSRAYGLAPIPEHPLANLPDDPHDLLAAIAPLSCKPQELVHSIDNGTAIRRAGNRDAAPASEVEQSLVTQAAQRSQHRIRVHANHCGEVLRGWQTIARFRLAFGNRASDLRSDLLVEVAGVGTVQLDFQHDARDNSFIPSVTTTPAPPEERELEALIEEAKRRARRRRLVNTALISAALLVAGGLYLAFDGGGGQTSQPSPTAASGAVAASAKEVLRGSPYMGVSCRVPNSFRCDRVGLAVSLREPALRVRAAIGGRTFSLDGPQRSEPAKRGERRTFAGFLQPAGLIDGPIQVTPDAGPHRWIGREPVSAPVKLWIVRDHGAPITTTVHVNLMAGWG